MLKEWRKTGGKGWGNDDQIQESQRRWIKKRGGLGKVPSTKNEPISGGPRRKSRLKSLGLGKRKSSNAEDWKQRANRYKERGGIPLRYALGEFEELAVKGDLGHVQSQSGE